MSGRWPLRLAFVGLALLVLATQAARFAADRVTGPAMPALAALAPRLAALAQPASSPSPEMLAAIVPGCPETLLVAPLSFSGAGFSTARALFGGAAQPRLIYLGLVGGPASAPLLLARWVAATALHATGLRQAPVPESLVVVALPRACPALRHLDWARLSPGDGT